MGSNPATRDHLVDLEKPKLDLLALALAPEITDQRQRPSVDAEMPPIVLDAEQLWMHAG